MTRRFDRLNGGGKLHMQSLCAKAALLKGGRAATIIGEVRAAVVRWPEFAAEGRLTDEWRDKIQKA